MYSGNRLGVSCSMFRTVNSGACKYAMHYTAYTLHDVVQCTWLASRNDSLRDSRNLSMVFLLLLKLWCLCELHIYEDCTWFELYCTWLELSCTWLELYCTCQLNGVYTVVQPNKFQKKTTNSSQSGFWTGEIVLKIFNSNFLQFVWF